MTSAQRGKQRHHGDQDIIPDKKRGFNGQKLTFITKKKKRSKLLHVFTANVSNCKQYNAMEIIRCNVPVKKLKVNLTWHVSQIQGI